MSVLQNMLQYLWTKLNSDDPCPTSRNLSKENNWYWCTLESSATATQCVGHMQCMTSNWQHYFCTCTSKMFFFHCVHIVRIVFVLTTLDSFLQTQDKWKAICFEETSDYYVDLDEKTTWDNLRSCTVLVLLDNTSHLNLIVSSFVFVKIVWCRPFEKKTKYKMKLDHKRSSMLQGQQPRYCIINSASIFDPLWSYLLNHTFLLLFIKVFH